MKEPLVNWKLLPVKAHYFFFNGAMSGVIPILPVFGGELGISAFAIGVIYTVLKILTVVAKVVGGAVADRFKNSKLLLMIGLSAIVLSMLGLSFTPRPEKDLLRNSTNLGCDNDTARFLSILRNCTIEAFDTITNKQPEDVQTVQFWVFTVLITITWLAFTICNSLSDAATYNVLQQNSHRFGRQRMFGSIGWGLFAALTGYLNDVFSDESRNYYSYSPGFYSLAVLLILDMSIVFQLDLQDAKMSKSIFTDVGKLVVKPRIFLFLLGVLTNGAFVGFNWSYLYWYLRELKADQLLLGLTTTVQCCSEIPFFILSGWMINKMGQINIISLASVAFSLRYFGYAYLVNPWWTLPLELFQGLGFAAFYAAITSYAKVVAPEGTEATMQGLVGGAFEGLGVAAGSLLGGVGFGWFGGRKTYLAAAIVAVVAATMHAALHKVLDILERRKSSSDTSVVYSFSPG